MNQALYTKLASVIEENATLFQFRNPDDIENVFRDFALDFDIVGDQVVFKKNGGRVDQASLLAQLRAASKPFLRVHSIGDYVPLYADQRSPEAKELHAQEVGKLVDWIFDKHGLKFRGERVEDFTLKNIVRSRISRDLLFEADENNEVTFRRFDNGLFSNRFSIDEVIHHYADPYLDADATTKAKERIQSELEAPILKKYGVTHRDQIDKRKADFYNADLNGALKEYKTPVTKKVLPAQPSDEIAREFSRRFLFRRGNMDEKELDLRQRSTLSEEVKTRMEGLNSLPNYHSQTINDLRNYKPPAESWGFKVENSGSAKIPADQL